MCRKYLNSPATWKKGEGRWCGGGTLGLLDILLGEWVLQHPEAPRGKTKIVPSLRSTIKNKLVTGDIGSFVFVRYGVWKNGTKSREWRIQGAGPCILFNEQAPRHQGYPKIGSGYHDFSSYHISLYQERIDSVIFEAICCCMVSIEAYGRRGHKPRE